MSNFIDDAALPTKQKEKQKKKISDYSDAQMVIERAEIVSMGGLLYIKNDGIYQTIDDEMLQKTVMENIDEIFRCDYNAKDIINIVKMIKIIPEISYDIKLVDSHVWTFKNMFVNALTQEKVEYSSETPFANTYIDSEFYKDMSECTPCFDEFLSAITADDSILKDRIYEMLGYILSNDINAEKFIYISGDDQSGRKELAEVIKGFFDKSRICNIDLFDMGNKFQFFSLIDKKININMDLSSGVLNAKNARILKQLTDKNNVYLDEHRFHSTYRIPNNCKHIFGSEYSLQLDNMDTAFLKRVLYIPLKNKIPAKLCGKEFIRRLTKEKTAIIKNAMRYYKRLVDNNYKFSGDEEYKMTTGNDGLLNMNDVIPMFIDQCCEKSAADDAFTFSYMLYDRFLSFCNENKISMPCTQFMFSSKLKKIHGNSISSQKRREPNTGKSLNGFKGIRIVEGKPEE